MPSRRAIALIFLFWLAVTSYVAYRDLWPLLFASGPPPIAIDLADEAAQNIPIRWTVNWNGKPVGKLVTSMKYLDADDTFAFTNTYKQLRVEVGGVTVFVPQLVSLVRVDREGNLLEQSADGTLELELSGVKIGVVNAKIKGIVTDGQLNAVFDGSYGFAGLKPTTMTKTLDPVPVAQGQPLNPLQPVNRIRGVRPGRQWVVNESNPLNDAVAAVAKQMGFNLPDQNRGPLYGEVLAEPRNLDCASGPVPCWVIEYRREEPEVRTWVRVSDGKVLRQEAFRKGENLTVDRDE